jgi:crotonobetainyl-CoA:carnitine CoA-transferase CaiB-like acyl-CoA transferase
MGPLAGLRVVELASEWAAFAGKLMADLGADVVLVEPPNGHRTRWFGPFVDDVADPEGSLWWWHYNTSKRGVVIDVEADPEVLRALFATADIVLEAEHPGRLRALNLDYGDLNYELPQVVWVSVTPFGRDGPRSTEAAIDLTSAAAGGPAWSCGYDDHGLPPVRPGPHQSHHTASIWAVMGALSAIVHRDSVDSRGQLVDVNVHAACNVTTECATYEWLVHRASVRRQTARHAWPEPTAPTTVISTDGRAATTGVPPRSPREFRILRDWLNELGLQDRLDDIVFLDMGTEVESLDLAGVGTDAETTAIVSAARDAITLIASHLTAYDFFVEGQRRGLTTGIVYSPEEVMSDPHFVDRGFVVDVYHDRLGRSVRYPGAPYRSTATSHHITRAPHLGEHDRELLGEPASEI